MYFKTLFFFVNVLLIVDVGESCHTFKNTAMEIKTKEGNSFNATVNGCLERKSLLETLGKETAVEIHINNANIPLLHRDSIRFLLKLRKLELISCGIQEIEPHLFRSVPLLSVLFLSFNNITEISNEVFSGLAVEQLHINDNPVDIIANNAFTNMTSLLDFFANNNKIKHYNREWFVSSTNLRLIDLQGNKIRSIPRRAFAANKKLRQIFLNNNDIDVLHAGAFEGLERLEYLGLRGNRISELKSEMFPDKLSITTLLIDANKLNYLSYDLLEKISVKNMTLYGNPWKCSCLDRINFWMYRRNGTVQTSSTCQGPSVPVCMYPRVFSTACLESVDHEGTEFYFSKLKEININRSCVRFD